MVNIVTNIVKLMYNLLEYSDKYSMTSGGLWNYHRDKIDGVDDDASNGKSRKYKTKIMQQTEDHQSLQ